MHVLENIRKKVQRTDFTGCSPERQHRAAVDNLKRQVQCVCTALNSSEGRLLQIIVHLPILGSSSQAPGLNLAANTST